MALNSQIRNIDLQANCDLTNYQAEIHDYEGFSKTNSLFMNKRILNWWKRGLDSSEVADDYTYTKDDDYFYLYYNNGSESTLKGKIKREYTKLAIVDSDAWRSEENIKKVVNPYYSDSEEDDNYYVVCGYTKIGTTDNADKISLSNGMTFGHNRSTGVYYLFDENNDLVWTYTSSIQNSDSFVDALYLSSAISFSDIGISFNIPANSVVMKGNTNVCAYVSLNDYSFHYFTASPETLFINNGTLSYYYYDSARTAISPSNVYYPDLLNRSTYYDSHGYTCNITNHGKYKTVQYVIAYSLNGNIFYITVDKIFGSNQYFKALNYSIKYGIWAVNYVNKIPENIAYNYHKLFNIEGNEDTDGTVTDIDGYTDSAIYFKYGTKSYKITIDKADDIKDVMLNVNDEYFIFYTTSYRNCYHVTNQEWFCSCDDWNNRAQWYNDDQTTNYWYLMNSRAGRTGWIDLTSPGTVSSQYASILLRYALTDDETDPTKMSIFWADDRYTAPYFEDENGDMQYQQYNVYMADEISSQTQSLSKKGYITQQGFTVDIDATDIWSEPSSSDSYQDNPPLLDESYTTFTQTITCTVSEFVYTLLTGSIYEHYLMFYTAETTTIQAGDKEFVINGSLYTWDATNERILDSNGQWVCNTDLFIYIGFSSKYAYFYCKFDHGIYAFNGDNTMSRMTTLEKYSVSKTKTATDESTPSNCADSLNIPSIDLVLFNLTTAIGILYGTQFAVYDLPTGILNSWSLNTSKGTFTVNGTVYSLIYDNIIFNDSEISNVPIYLETEFYGAEGTEYNTINDCVYVTLDNYNNKTSGSITLQVKALVNNKVVTGKVKTFNLTSKDFNGAGACGLKFQPDIQECYGFKLIIESDFEIAEIKIGTSQGAINQSRFRS